MEWLIMALVALGVDIVVDNIKPLRRLTHKNAILESTNELIDQMQDIMKDPEALKALVNRGEVRTSGQNIGDLGREAE